jgi:hypothetical protein
MYSNVFDLIASQIFSLQEFSEVFLLSSDAFGVANSLNAFLYHSECHSLYVQTNLVQIILKQFSVNSESTYLARSNFLMVSTELAVGTALKVSSVTDSRDAFMLLFSALSTFSDVT